MTSRKQLAEAIERGDQVTIRILLSMRREPLESLRRIRRALEEQRDALAPAQARQLAELLNRAAAAGKEEERLAEQVAVNGRLLRQLVELDRILNRKLGGKKSLYHKKPGHQPVGLMSRQSGKARQESAGERTQRGAPLAVLAESSSRINCGSHSIRLRSSLFGSATRIMPESVTPRRRMKWPPLRKVAGTHQCDQEVSRQQRLPERLAACVPQGSWPSGHRLSRSLL